MNQDLIELKKMTEALLRSEGLVAWVGGYVYGRTSQDDPFIILYPAADYLKEKVCRVYPHDFKRIPDFIPTADIPADTDANPSKGQAQRAGIYHECRPFKIVMHLGKDTPLGKEKRFGDVLYVPAQRAAASAAAPSQPAENAPVSPARPEPPAEASPAENGDGDEDGRDHWRIQAAMAGEPFMFDTAVVKLAPWYKDSENVAKFRSALFGEFDAGRTGAYTVALEAYAYERKSVNGRLPRQVAHRQAKKKALTAYRRATGRE